MIPVEQLVLAAVIVGAGQLYAVGARRRRPKHAFRRGACFAAALVLLEVALCAPFHRLADESLAAHMLQHVVLMSYVSPLLVLAAPWLTVWRGLPLVTRRRLARRVVALPATLRRSLRMLVAPWPAWLLLNVDLAVWHVPWLYDLTLRNGGVHELEHASYLLFGVLFWLPIVDSSPVRARLRGMKAVAYAVAGMATGWVLALVLAFAPAPLYPVYAALRIRAFGLSALADQQLAGGVMLALGSIPLSIAVFVFVYRWLDDTARTAPRHTATRSATAPSEASRFSTSTVVMTTTKPPGAGRTLRGS